MDFKKLCHENKLRKNNKEYMQLPYTKKFHGLGTLQNLRWSDWTLEISHIQRYEISYLETNKTMFIETQDAADFAMGTWFIPTPREVNPNVKDDTNNSLKKKKS